MFPNEEVPFFLNAQEGGDAGERRDAKEKRYRGIEGECVATERCGVREGVGEEGRQGRVREGGKQERMDLRIIEPRVGEACGDRDTGRGGGRERGGNGWGGGGEGGWVTDKGGSETLRIF